MYILSQFKKSILEKKKGLQLSFYLKKLEEKSRRNPKSKIYDKYQRRNQWNRKQTIQKKGETTASSLRLKWLNLQPHVGSRDSAVP